MAHIRGLVALGALVFLAACGIDGPPERPEPREVPPPEEEAAETPPGTPGGPTFTIGVSGSMGVVRR